MITKNGKKFFGTLDTTSFYLKSIDGNEWHNDKYSFSDKNSIIVGSGNRTPTTSDYQLESMIIDLTEIAESTSYPNDYSSYMYSTQATFKNNTERNITVREIGAVVKLGSTDESRCLLIREVLDTPVVIKPQKSYTFSITL